MAPPIHIDQDDAFTIDDVEFVIDVPPRRPSAPGSFSIGKSEPYIREYEQLADELSPAGVLELGIFQGGSFVFIDKLLAPRSLAAIDLTPDPVEPLVRYCDERPRRHAHFGTSQSDRAALERIVSEELDSELDLVIDDASHAYEYTKASFDILFPLLRPGGIYIIEDWSWAHHPDYQAKDSAFADEPALTNLLLEQVLAIGTHHMIDEIRIRRFMYLLRKAEGVPEFTADEMWDVLSRGKTLTQI